MCPVRLVAKHVFNVRLSMRFAFPFKVTVFQTNAIMYFENINARKHVFNPALVTETYLCNLSTRYTVKTFCVQRPPSRTQIFGRW